MSEQREPIHYGTDRAWCHDCGTRACATCWDTGNLAGFGLRMRAGHGWDARGTKLVCYECARTVLNAVRHVRIRQENQ